VSHRRCVVVVFRRGLALWAVVGCRGMGGRHRWAVVRSWQWPRCRGVAVVLSHRPCAVAVLRRGGLALDLPSGRSLGVRRCRGCVVRSSVIVGVSWWRWAIRVGGRRKRRTIPRIVHRFGAMSLDASDVAPWRVGRCPCPFSSVGSRPLLWGSWAAVGGSRCGWVVVWLPRRQDGDMAPGGM
jgi:hypothetical protein